MKKLKILFINPCLRRNHPTKILPIGLAYVMTSARKAGFNFDLLDIDINDHDDAYVESFISQNRYDVILYGSIVTHYKWIKWLTHTIKKHHPDTKVVVGNSVAGSCHAVFMNNAPADVAVIGEGDITTVEVLRAIAAGEGFDKVEGIAHRAPDGTLRTNLPREACDIDSLPLVEWDLFDVSRYLKTQGILALGQEKDGAVNMPVVTARGCVFKCTFCHYVFWDSPYRHRNPESVIAEIRRSIDTYGANYINFWDDLSFPSLVVAEKMVDAILASGLKFDWMASVRTDLFGNPRFPLDRRRAVAEKMRKAGCLNLGFSLESANREILKMMNKKVEVEYFPEHVRILKEAGIACNISVVFGYPIETKETIRETFDMCYANNIYPSIGFLLPLPYTGMYDYAKTHGFIKDEDAFLTSITERQDICLNMTKMSDEEIMGEIKSGAKRINELLNLGLNDKTYIKTGGYKKHTNIRKQLDSGKVKRNENDFSLNYSDAVFDMDRGVGREGKSDSPTRA